MSGHVTAVSDSKGQRHLWTLSDHAVPAGTSSIATVAPSLKDEAHVGAGELQITKTLQRTAKSSS